MQQNHTRALAMLLLTMMITTPVAAQTVSVAKCQTIKDRIERYTGQRRKGGSASQMQQWKQQLLASEEQFRRQECKKHRRKMQ